MKSYTLWKMDDTRWLLEIEDEALGDYIKDVVAKDNSKIERFGIGINVPLRVYVVSDDDVLAVEKQIDSWVRRHNG